MPLDLFEEYGIASLGDSWDVTRDFPCPYIRPMQRLGTNTIAGMPLECGRWDCARCGPSRTERMIEPVQEYFAECEDIPLPRYQQGTVNANGRARRLRVRWLIYSHRNRQYTRKSVLLRVVRLRCTRNNYASDLFESRPQAVLRTIEWGLLRENKTR